MRKLAKTLAQIVISIPMFCLAGWLFFLSLQSPNSFAAEILFGIGIFSAAVGVYVFIL